ncbi:Tetraspanin [Gryllus bimaculatus]|nr:Tetraspanin [Gryllus bimaculatus]
MAGSLLFWLSGLLIVIVGAVVFAAIDDYRTFMESRVLGPPIVLIVAGLIIFVIAFLGCWGALQESCNMLIAYAVLLLLIFIIELAVGITAAVVRDDFGDTMEMEMKKSMERYKDEEVQRVAWDTLQEKFECCGVHKVDDWEGVIKPGIAAPSSCCVEKGEICVNTSRLGMYQLGCYSKLEEKVQSSVICLAGIGIGIAFIELAGIILALLLVHAIRTSAPK